MSEPESSSETSRRAIETDFWIEKPVEAHSPEAGRRLHRFKINVPTVADSYWTLTRTRDSSHPPEGVEASGPQIGFASEDHEKFMMYGKDRLEKLDCIGAAMAFRREAMRQLSGPIAEEVGSTNQEELEARILCFDRLQDTCGKAVEEMSEECFNTGDKVRTIGTILDRIESISPFGVSHKGYKAAMEKQQGLRNGQSFVKYSLEPASSSDVVSYRLKAASVHPALVFPPVTVTLTGNQRWKWDEEWSVLLVETARASLITKLGAIEDSMGLIKTCEERQALHGPDGDHTQVLSSAMQYISSYVNHCRDHHPQKDRKLFSSRVADACSGSQGSVIKVDLQRQHDNNQTTSFTLGFSTDAAPILMPQRKMKMDGSGFRLDLDTPYEDRF